MKVLQDEQLVVNVVAVVMDREQGGKQSLEARGLRVFSLLKLSQVTAFLEKQLGQLPRVQLSEEAITDLSFAGMLCC